METKRKKTFETADSIMIIMNEPRAQRAHGRSGLSGGQGSKPSRSASSTKAASSASSSSTLLAGMKGPESAYYINVSGLPQT